MKSRFSILAVLALAITASTASADGICVCGMKRPLRVEGPTPQAVVVVGHVMPRPTLADDLTCCVLKRPL